MTSGCWIASRCEEKTVRSIARSKCGVQNKGNYHFFQEFWLHIEPGQRRGCCQIQSWSQFLGPLCVWQCFCEKMVSTDRLVTQFPMLFRNNNGYFSFLILYCTFSTIYIELVHEQQIVQIVFGPFNGFGVVKCCSFGK